MESLRVFAALLFVLAGGAIISAFTAPLPWYLAATTALGLVVTGVVLLALDRIVEVLTEIRDGICAAQEGGEEEPEAEGFLHADD